VLLWVHRCSRAIVVISGVDVVSWISYPLEYSLGEVLQQYICVLANSFVLIGVPKWILHSR
jgi:hypothetical protein